MRLPANGRYGYPLIRPSTFRAFLMDQSSPYDSARCLIDGYALAWSASPKSISSPSGTGKLGVYEGPASITSNEQYAVLGDSTMHMIVRVDSGSPNLFWYNNDIADVYVDSNKAIGFYSNNTYDEVNSPSGAFEYGEWFVCTLRKRNTARGVDGLPTAGGTSTVEIMVNGQLVAQKTNFATGTVSGLPALQIGQSSGLAVDGFFYYAEPLSDDAIAEDVRRVHQLRTHARAGLKVTVEDQNGEYRDLTDLNGVDWVTSASVTDELDAPTMTANVSLVREQGEQSVATLVTDAQLNLQYPGDVTSYVSPFLDLGRGIEIFSARVPVGIDPDGRDWFSVFKGNIDEIKEGGNNVELSCRDLGSQLIDTYIETEREYSDPEDAYAVEGEMQSILNDNSSTFKTGSYAPVTLYTPTSPGWDVLGWIQRREPVMSALRTLAGQIGWDVRYRYDRQTDAWRLTLFAPERDSPRATTTITRDDILEVTSLSRSLLGIRNVVRVVYPSSETTSPTAPTPPAGISVSAQGWNNVDGEGQRMTAYIELTDSAAITRVGRRLFMEVAEASSSQIDTIGEAYDMAYSMLSDLNEEDLAKSITIPLMPELELNDLPKVMPIPELFTAPQRLAVKRLTHNFDAAGATTTVEMRGKPAVGQKRWLTLDTRAGGGKPAVIDPTQAISDLTTGTLLATMRNFLDRTGYFQGGKYLQIRNNNFSAWSAGLNNDPDGWTISAPNPSDIVPTADSQNGGHALSFSSSNAFITSDYIPINGSYLTPFSVDVTFKSLTFSGSNRVRITLLFYGPQKNFLSQGYVDTNDPETITNVSRTSNVVTITTANHLLSAGAPIRVFPGGAVDDNQGCYTDFSTVLSVPSGNTLTYSSAGIDFSNADNPRGILIKLKSTLDTVSIPTNNKWDKKIINGIQGLAIGAANSAAYVRVRVAQAPGSASSVIVDSVNLYQSAVHTRMGIRASEGMLTGQWVRADFNRANIIFGGFDYGTGLQRFPAGSPTVYSLSESNYKAQSDQRVRFFAKYTVTTGSGTCDVRLRAVKNRVYDSSSMVIASGGTELVTGNVFSRGGAGAPNPNYTIASLEGTAELKSGDKLTIEAFISAPTSPPISVSSPDYSFFDVKEEFLD